MYDSPRIKAAYLAGTSYCGSTLLAFLLNAHPQIVSVGEASINRKGQKSGKVNYLCSCGTLLKDCVFWHELFRMVHAEGLEFGIRNWTNDYKYKNSILHKFLSTYPSNTPLRVFQNIACHILPFHKRRVEHAHRVNVAFMQAAFKLTRAEVFFDTSKALMRLSYLLKIPALDVQVVRVVRDVRAFANSYKSRGVSVAQAARHWKNYQESADYLLNTMPSCPVLLMRYEDFCHDPVYWLKSLHTFLGVQPLDPPDTITPSEHHIIGNHMRLQKITAITANHSWREKLSATELRQILHIAGDMNERFGYHQNVEAEERTHNHSTTSVLGERCL
jgi:Sulfotransferase domain